MLKEVVTMIVKECSGLLQHRIMHIMHQVQDHEDDTVSSWVGNVAIRSSTFKPVLVLVAIHIFGS